MFDAYARAGFLPDLLPILPPNAELWPQSAGLAEKRGKVPGKYAFGKWVGLKDWTAINATDADIARWSKWPSAGLGIQCRRIAGIDVDVSDKLFAKKIHDLIQRRFKGAPVRVGRPPRHLHVVRLEAPIAKMRLAFTFEGIEGVQAVEILGTGQQFVAEGTHSGTGKPYWWDGKRSPLEVGFDGLPLAREDELREQLDHIAALVSEHGGKIVGTSEASIADRAQVNQDALRGAADAVIAALNMIPNELSYDDWVRMTCAVKAAAGEDAYAAWEEWSLQWEQNTPEACREKWDSFTPPFALGASYVFEQAKAFGFRPAVLEFGGTVDDAVRPASPSTLPPRTTEPASAGAAPAANPFENSEAHERMIRDFGFIVPLKSFVDVRTGTLFDDKQFNRVQTDVAAENPAADAPVARFLRDRRKRIFVGSTYMPNSPIETITLRRGVEIRTYNGWRPSELEPAPGPIADEDVRPWLDHLALLFPSTTEQGHLLDWCAHTVQKPELKINWGPLIGGDQGIGKDTLMKPIIEAIGRGNFAEIDADQLAGDFNEYVLHKKLLQVNEMHQVDRKALNDKMKPLLAAPPVTLQVNKKFTPLQEVPNILAVIMFTNQPNAVLLEDGDRRMVVLWSRAERQPPEYFARLYGWMDAGGSAKVYRWLLQRDLAAFNPKAPAPHTAAKDDMRDAGRPQVEAWLKAQIEDAQGIFSRDLLTVQEIIEALPRAANASINPITQGRMLERLGCRNLGQIRLASSRARVWAIRGLETYRGLEADRLAHLYTSQREEWAKLARSSVF